MGGEAISRRGFLAASTLALAASRGRGQEGVPEPVRLAFIGVGSRGTGLLRQLLRIPGTAVPAICDIRESALNRGIAIVQKACGNTPAGFSRDEYDYRRMLQRDDFDAVLIATPARWHALMAKDAMKAGKHVASEVPGAHTLEECWDLVKTKESTARRYMLLENYVYARSRLMVYNMVHAGVLGDAYYAECSYIHDCRHLRFNPDGSLTWRGESKRDHYGNLYPTHSLGPVAKWLDVNRGDVMVSLASQMSRPAALREYAVRRFGPDGPQAKMAFKAGDHSVTLIKTARGRLITVYYDSDSPRPLSIFYLVQGPKGCYDSRNGIYVDGKSPSHRWEPESRYLADYDHELWKTQGKAARASGHGGGDYLELAEFVDAVRSDREPFVDVYDSAAWSSLIPLSKQSIDQGGGAVEMPDFTRGAWKSREP